MQLHCKKKCSLIIPYTLTHFTRPQVVSDINFFVTSSEPLFVNSNIYFVSLSLVVVMVGRLDFGVYTCALNATVQLP